MRAIFVLSLVLGLAAPALSQPVPDTLRSSSLTQAQQSELNRRLALLQNRLGALASETQLRETAVRNIATEIFGARPDLDFETYTRLIDSGARQLRDYIGAARQRTEADPALAALRDRAITAAEEGRLSDARAIYNELIAANRDARRAARHAEDLADATDIAEAARLALIARDHREATRLYGEAADIAPSGERVRWLYRVMQASNMIDPIPPQQQADPAMIANASRLLQESASDAPVDWRSLVDQLASATADIDRELYIAAAGVEAAHDLYANPSATE
jgi:hypothetical protein